MTDKEQIMQLQIEADALYRLLHKVALALNQSRERPSQEFVESVKRQVSEKIIERDSWSW